MQCLQKLWKARRREISDSTHTAGLLRECCEWQRRRTANKRNELAPSHVPPMSALVDA
jgi:hypothetical protein